MKKTNFRKATLSALLMLVVAVVSLTGVTYAWFTSGTTAEVNNINMTVQGAAGGLQIALPEDYAFGSTISFNDVTNEDGYKPVSTSVSELNPKSAEGAYQEGKFYTAAVGTSAQTIKSVVNAAKGSDYFAQSILIDNYGGTEKTIRLSGDVTFGDKSKGTEKAIRVAIVIDGYTLDPKYDAAQDTFALEDVTQVYIFEPNAKSHTAAGINEAKLDTINTANGGDYSNIPFNYFGLTANAKQAVGEISKYEAGEGNYLEAVTTYAMDNTLTNQADIKIRANALVKATIYVWIEGQDHDCHNDIAGGNIIANLDFTVVSPQNQTPDPGQEG